ncbi:MAG: hypothetical protein DIZ78_15630 [endosymbiont of Escarpia spicata]|uniref:Peptidase M48 domain-containing protein n=1 Tax=endosymbiont of Escarpia spicata TaxID=2200908 RepID=A0A370DBC1_9GAMM|nr:MAG: hypothetical protein DIZ78_15630 [endosymbiont of Escarpia spicata]
MSIKRRLMIPFLGLCISLLFSGASHGGIGDFFTSVKETVGSAVGSVGRAVGLSDRTSGLEGTLLDQLTAEQDAEEAAMETEQSAGDSGGFQQDILLLRRAGEGVAQLSELEQYLNGVKDKLLTAWPGRKIQTHVYISPSPDFAAQALPNGVISIPLGTLLKLKNEDQLAALLGHELSHLILEHHQKDTLSVVSERLLDYSDLYLQVAVGKGKAGAADYAKLKVADWALKNAFFPNWNRGQENEADYLGADLLIRAGYNGDAMLEVLKLIEFTAQKRVEFVERNPVATTQSPKGSPELKIDFNQLLSNVSDDLKDQLSHSHEDAKERRKQIRKYVRASHPDRARPAFIEKPFLKVMKSASSRKFIACYKYAYEANDLMLQAKEKPGILTKAAASGLKGISGSCSNDPYTRMVMFQVRYYQNKGKSAVTNLTKAYKSGQAPYNTYTMLSDIAYKKGEFKTSLVFQQALSETFKEDVEYLPRMIATRQKLGQKAGELSLLCIATGKAKLITRCDEAKKGMWRPAI